MPTPTTYCTVGTTPYQYWSGWWDQPSEGTFSDATGRTKLPPGGYHPWYLGEPNGNTEENCGVVWADRGAWNDDSCSKEACGFCQLERAPVMTLRGCHLIIIIIITAHARRTTVAVTPGLCRGSLFDTKYSWTRETEGDFFVFSGYKDAVMSLDDRGAWQITLHSTNQTYATSNATDYPFGQQEWLVYNDPCFGRGKVSAVLNFNACNDSEFNCVDGQCISMEARCDGILHCEDSTGQ